MEAFSSRNILPQNYHHGDMKQYFEDCLCFIQNHQWICNFQLTNYFVNRVWENIPKEWKEILCGLPVEELNRVPYGYMKEEWPSSLKEFIKASLALSLDRDIAENVNICQIPKELQRGMNPKKIHEVAHLAMVVDSVCQQNNVRHVVDVGSGLGYLSLVLSDHLGYNVLGVECEESRSHGAEARASKLKSQSAFTSIPVRLDDSLESMDTFQTAIKDTFSKITKCNSCDQEGTCDCSTDKLHCSLCKLHLATHHDTSACGDKMLCEKCKLCSMVQTRVNPKVQNLSLENSGKQNQCDQNIDAFHMSCYEQSDIKSLVCKSCNISSISGKGCTDCKCKEYLSNIHESTISSPVKGTCSHGCSENAPQVKTDVEKLSILNQSSKSERGNVSCASNEIEDRDGHRAPSVCLLGLHSCGDLTPVMLKLFSKVDDMRCLVCLGCCYHKMSTDGDNDCYHQFPLSTTLKELWQQRSSDVTGTWLSTFSLRLAAQETRARWMNQEREQHDQHTRNVAYRALLELACCTGKISPQREKWRLPCSHKNFDAYAEEIFNKVTLNTGVLKEDCIRTLMDSYSQYEPFFCTIEPFTCLQVLLQPVIESLILVDRAVFLAEQGHHVKIVPVAKELLSPRNLAIIAWK